MILELLQEKSGKYKNKEKSVERIRNYYFGMYFKFKIVC